MVSSCHPFAADRALDHYGPPAGSTLSDEPAGSETVDEPAVWNGSACAGDGSDRLPLDVLAHLIVLADKAAGRCHMWQ